MFFKKASRSFTEELERKKTPFLETAMPLEVDKTDVNKFYFVADALSSGAYAIVKKKDGTTEKVGSSKFDEIVKNKDIESVEHYIEGIASSTNIDHEHEKMNTSAIQSMKEYAKDQVIPLRNAHSLEWDSKIGVMTEIDSEGEGEDSLLKVKFKLNDFENDATAKKLWYFIGSGEEIGLSIGGVVLDWEWEWEEATGIELLIFKEIFLKEVSVTAMPSNKDTFIEAVGKSLRKSRQIAGLPETRNGKRNKSKNVKLKSIEDICKAIGQTPLGIIENVFYDIIKMSTEEQTVLTEKLLSVNLNINPEVMKDETTKTKEEEIKKDEVEVETKEEIKKDEVEVEVKEEVEEETKEEIKKDEKTFLLSEKDLAAIISKSITAAIIPLEEKIKDMSTEKSKTEKSETTGSETKKADYKEKTIAIKKGEAVVKENIDTSKKLGAELNDKVGTPLKWFNSEKSYTKDEAKAIIKKFDSFGAHQVTCGNILDVFD